MRILSMTWLLVLAFPIAGHAQESGTGATTESGTVLEATTTEILQHVLDIAPTRVARNAKQFLIPEKEQAAWEKESAYIRGRMNNQRTDCIDLIRKSNRDQRIGKMLQCQRAMLLLEAGLLRKQSSYIELTPLADSTLVTSATNAIANLESAVMAIVDGIDTGLFTSEEQLLAARNNLRMTYREPAWKALTLLRVDRELTNILYIAKLLKERPDVHSSPLVREVASCLEGVAGLFRSNFSVLDRHEISTELTAARAESETCRGLLRALSKADRQQEKN